MNLRIWQHTTTKAARELVHSIITAQTVPISTQQLYKLVVRKELTVAGKPVPHSIGHASKIGTKAPYPSHVVRSMSYLKNAVLPDLLKRMEVQKVHTIRTLTPEEIEQRLKTMTKAARRSAELTTTVDTWMWQSRAPPAKADPRPARAPFGVEVGVGVDWSHLNKRRQRSREESVSRDMAWMRKLEKAKSEGVSKVAAASAP